MQPISSELVTNYALHYVLQIMNMTFIRKTFFGAMLGSVQEIKSMQNKKKIMTWHTECTSHKENSVHIQ